MKYYKTVNTSTKSLNGTQKVERVLFIYNSASQDPTCTNASCATFDMLKKIVKYLQHLKYVYKINIEMLIAQL